MAPTLIDIDLSDPSDSIISSKLGKQMRIHAAWVRYNPKICKYYIVTKQRFWLIPFYETVKERYSTKDIMFYESEDKAIQEAEKSVTNIRVISK